MTNILLLFSIILNIIALFCIVILYLRQNRFLQVEKKQEKLLGEMEEVISAYLIEMTEENEKFIGKVKELVNRQNPPTASLVNRHKSDKRETDEEVDNERENRTSGLKHEIKREQKIEPNLEPDEKGSKKENEEKEFPTFRKGTVYQAAQAYKSSSVVDTKSNLDEPVLPFDEPDNKIEEAALPQQANQSGDLSAQSFYYQILLLKKQGLTTEDIARRLNKGKTEIELLLKLRQNNKE